MAEAPGGISDGKSKPVPEVIPNTVRKRDPGNTMTLTMDQHYENQMMALETPTSAETQMKFEVIGSPGATVAKNIQNNYFQTGSQLEEIKASSATALKEFKKKPFVPTLAAKTSLQRLKEKSFICIEGRDVSGKTEIGYYLLTQLGKKKYIPIILNGPEEYQWLQNERYAVLIDDIFGKRTFSTEMLGQWNKKFEDIFRRVRAGDVYLVMTSQEGFYDKSLTSLSMEGIFEKANRLDLDTFSLRNHEKFEILESLAKVLGQPRDTNLLTETVLTKQNPWFFHCCKHLLKHRKPLETWPKFFEYPVSIIFEQVRNLHRAEPVKVVPLILILRDGCLSDLTVDGLDSFSQELLRKIGRDIVFTETDIRHAVSSMVVSFLAREKGTYVFLNDVVRDAVCFAFWDIDPTYSIKWFPADFLTKHTALESSDPFQYIQVPREHFRELNTRLQQIFKGGTPSYEYFQTEDFGKLFLEVHLRCNNQPVNLQIVTVLVIASVLYGFQSLLQKCLEVWQQHVPSSEKVVLRKKVLEHLTVHKICEMKTFKSADILSKAGYRACIPQSCEICTSNDASEEDVPLCLQLSNMDQIDDDYISNILKWIVQSSSIDTVSDFFMCIDPVKQFEFCNAGMNVACEMGKHEMYENFRSVAGGMIVDFNALVESSVKGGNILILSHLLQEFKRVRLTIINFEQACVFNKVEMAKMIWEDAHDVRETCREDKGFREDVLQKVVTIVDADCEELLGWLLSKGFLCNESTALHSACLSGNRKAFTLLLKKYTSANTMDKYGNTALHLQCMGQSLNVHVIEQLLSTDADVNTKNKENETPLHVLCANQHPVRSLVLKRLLLKQTDVNTTDLKGNSPLYILLDTGFSLEEMELLLESKADVFKRNGQGETPLHAACRSRNVRAVEKLVGLKVDINTVDTNGATCLHHAVSMSNNHETVAYLLKQSNPVNLLLTITDNDGNTPLHLAMTTADNECSVSLLLNYGANVLAQNKYGLTPFHIACSICNMESHRFISTSAEHCKNTFAMEVKNSPLHLACKSNGESAAKIMAQLLEWEANKDCVDEEGKTPLHVACEMSTRVSLDIARELCAREACMESLDEDGNTPLLLAYQSRGEAKVDMIQHLLNQGASPLKCNNAGVFPLMMMFRDGAYEFVRMMMDTVILKACESKEAHILHNVEDALSLQIDWSQVYDNTHPLLLRVCGQHGMNTSTVVGVILKSGFDFDVTDVDGKTAVHAACGDVGPHTVSVLKVLQENGCSMSLLDSHARTALHVAVDSDNGAVEEVLDFLFDSGLDVNSVDADGNTPLHVACGSRKVKVRKSIHWLLNHDADVTYRNHNKESCFNISSAQTLPFVNETLMNEVLLKHCEGFLTDKRLVSKILKGGADINCTDFDGNTIIHLLVLMAGKVDVRKHIQLAKTLGGDLRIKNNDDKTAYEIALHGCAAESLLKILYCDETTEETGMSASGVCPVVSVEKTSESSTREEIVDGVANVIKKVFKIIDIIRE